MPDLDTVALYLFDNDLTEVKGGTDLTNPNSVPFSSSTKKEGSHSAGRFSNDNHFLRTPNIATAIRTIECYFFYPTGHKTPNRHLWGINTNNRIRMDGNNLDLVVNGAASGPNAISLDVFIHVAVTYNDGGLARLFVDNVQLDTVTQTFVPSSVVYEIGNGAHGGSILSCDGFIDSFRLSSAVRTSFPTPLISITDVIPSEGPATGGSLMQIEGTDFDGTEAITFGVVPASDILLIDSTKLTCTAPAVDVGTHDVTVEYPG